MRSSDINRLRKLRHAQAVLLGCVFEKHVSPRYEYGHGRWYMTVPLVERTGYSYGPYSARHEAVAAALRLLGVELKDQDYRHGNKGAAGVLPDGAAV